MTIVLHDAPHLLRLAGAVLLALGVTACDAAADRAPTAAGGTSDMPPVQVDQVVELVADGRNLRRQAYGDALQACREAGFQTRPLSEDDVARIGTSRYRLWFSSDLEAIRREDWDFGMADGAGAGSCLFEVTYSGTQDTWEQGRHVAVDLESGQSSDEALEPDALARQPAEASAASDEPGVTGPADRQVAGQPCKEWINQSLDTRQCVWSGGAPWGFHDGPEHGYKASRDFIILEQEPLGGNGTRVTTRSMSAGKAFDPAQLAPATGNARSAEARP